MLRPTGIRQLTSMLMNHLILQSRAAARKQPTPLCLCLGVTQEVCSLRWARRGPGTGLVVYENRYLETSKFSIGGAKFALVVK